MPFIIALTEAIVAAIAWILGIVVLLAEGGGVLAVLLLLFGWIGVLLVYVINYFFISIVLSPIVLHVDYILSIEKEQEKSDSDDKAPSKAEKDANMAKEPIELPKWECAKCWRLNPAENTVCSECGAAKGDMPVSQFSKRK